MKLATRTLTCGGPRGCGAQFEFPEGTTTEEAAKAIREHREEPNHQEMVLVEQNTKRLLEGLAPLTKEELFGKKDENKTAERPAVPFLRMIEESNQQSLKNLRGEIKKMKAEVAKP